MIDLAFYAGIALAIVAGPLGCFVVWRRMAYFGDGLSHSALLGVALGMAASLQTELAILLVGLVFVSLLFLLQRRRLLASDTLLGILAHATLALGLLAMTLMGADTHDVHEFLIGSLNAITTEQAVYIILGSASALLVLLRFWSGLVLMTVNEDLAQAEGVAVRRYEAVLMIIMALIVSVAIQLVGILLITSLLIIPAACARLLARTPEHMAIGAAIIGSICVSIGYLIALQSTLAPGPLIVSALVGFFVLLVAIRGLIKHVG